MKREKRPRDPNQLAKLIVDLAAGVAVPEAAPQKNAAAVAIGRLGGLKGGKARAAKLSKQQRIASAKAAARTRWGRKQKA